MSVRELHILGTSSQFPTKSRNQIGFFIKWDNLGILVDPGEGTQQQLTRMGISASRITHILITHFHGDHCLGLPGVIQRISADKVSRPVKIYYPSSGQSYFEALNQASDFYNQAKIESYSIENSGIIHQTDIISITCHWMIHSVDTLGFRIDEPPRRSLLPAELEKRGIKGADIGTLQSKGTVCINGRTISIEEVSEEKNGLGLAIILDTKYCEAAVKLSTGADMLICDSTFLTEEDRPNSDVCHMTAQEAASLAKEAKAKRLVLTHFSSRYDSLEEFASRASEIHPNAVAPHDGTILNLRNGEIIAQITW